MEWEAGSSSSNAVLKIRIISELSLLTIVLSFLSHRTGTVNLRLLCYIGSNVYI